MDLSLIIDAGAAFLLDAVLGDPPRFPHPVRFIGRLIAKAEKVLRSAIHSGGGQQAAEERIAGAILTLFVVGATFGGVFGILAVAKQVSPVIFHGCNIYFIYSALAGRCLANESFKVYRLLRQGDLAGARKQVGMLVGRDTHTLDEKGIVRAVVETAAENTVDGILSPLFFIFLGLPFGMGAPLAYAFKAASTLDSMVGYKNERYFHFGRASAKLDDALNYIPARLSGVFIPAAAFCCGKGFRHSFQTMLRDRRNHQSPNCAYPEAAMAGALGVRMGGTNIYFGQPVEKPTIGDDIKELELRDIPETIKIMWVTSFLFFAVGVGVLWVIGCL